MSFTFSSMSGSSGITQITVSATSRQELTTIVNNYTLANQTNSVLMPIVQKAYEPLEKHISFQPNSLSVDSSGGTSSITILSNDEWEIVSDDWIQLSRYESETKGSHNSLNGDGNTIVGLRFSENTGSSRNGGISGYCKSDSATSATTTVQQSGSYVKPYINLSYYSLEVSDTGITSSVTISSNISWYASTDSNWITVDMSSNDEHSALTYTVASNADYLERTGTIVVSNTYYGINAKLVITQQESSIKPYIELAPSSFSVDASGSTGNVITVRANCDYDIDSDSTWITVDSASGSGDGSVTFSTNSNVKVTSDVGNIVFSNSALSRTVTVSRKSVKTYLSASTSSITTNVNSAESITVEVYSNVKWEAECLNEEGKRIKPDWFLVEPDYGSNNGSIKIHFKFGNRSRYGYVRIYSIEYNLSWNIYLKQLNTTRLFYTTTDGEILQLTTDQIGNVPIIDHNYQNGVGMIEFDGDLRTINSGVCSGQTRLMTLEFPDALKTISENAFYGCTGLTGELVFPESMQYEAGLGGGVIGIRAFYGKSSISKIVIKGNTQMIGYEAFNGPLNNTNRDLNSIYCYSTTPPNQYTDRMYIIPSGLGGKLHCPVGTYDAYYNALHSEVEFRDWTFIDDL